MSWERDIRCIFGRWCCVALGYKIRGDVVVGFSFLFICCPYWLLAVLYYEEARDVLVDWFSLFTSHVIVPRCFYYS